jgi:hypothetical protein
MIEENAASPREAAFFVPGVRQPRHFRPRSAARLVIEFMTRSFQNP